MCGEIIHSHKLSIVDYVKEQATKIGWQGNKQLEDRRFISDLKDALTRYNDSPYNEIVRRIFACVIYSGIETNHGDFLIFADMREYQDMSRFYNEYKSKTVRVFIERKDCEPDQTNHADLNVLNNEYDYFIDNNGSVEQLKQSAKTFIEDILNKCV